ISCCAMLTGRGWHTGSRFGCLSLTRIYWSDSRPGSHQTFLRVSVILQVRLLSQWRNSRNVQRLVLRPRCEIGRRRALHAGCAVGQAKCIVGLTQLTLTCAQEMPHNLRADLAQRVWLNASVGAPKLQIRVLMA